MQDNNKSKLKKVFSTILILVLVIGIGVGCFFLGMNYANYENKPKEETKEKNDNEKEETPTPIITKDEIIREIKNDYLVKDLLKMNNLTYWKFNKISFYGYYEDKKDFYYYQVNTTYKCINNETDCIYLSQEANTPNDKKEIELTFYARFNNEKEIQSIEYIPPTGETFIKEEDNIIEDAISLEIYEKALKDKYKSQGIYTEKNIEYWNIINVEYVITYEDKDYYQFIGEYKCKDLEGDCVYLEQISEPNKDKSYDYKIYGTITNDNELIKVDNLTGTI